MAFERGAESGFRIIAHLFSDPDQTCLPRFEPEAGLQNADAREVLRRRHPRQSRETFDKSGTRGTSDASHLLALPLLVPRVRANDTHDAFASHHLALLAALSNGSLYLHALYLKR